MHLNAIGALDNRNLGAVAGGRLCGGVASDAGTDDNDVVIFRFSDIFNRLWSNFPRVLDFSSRCGLCIR